MVAVGDVWEGHELVSEIERGMVRTFLARQVGDTRSLVWLHVREGSRTERNVFADEIRRLRQIAELVPKIDPVLYGGIRNSVAWVASTFHPNAIPLKQATRKADLGLTALKIAIELGESLARGNNLGWLHGAMNPEHVIITQRGDYLITCFGFVRLFEPGEEEAGRQPRYAAPELLLGKRRLSKRTDVYGLGTILYELICARELYAGELNLAYHALTQEPSLPMRVPDKIRHVIAKTLAKRPEDRYPNVDHLIQELHSLADDWDKLHAPQTPEQILDTLRSSSNVLKESPELPSSPSPLRGTLPITSREPNDGTESAPVTELGTLDPPSPRVYDVQSIDESIPVPSKPSLAPEAPHSPGHPTWIRQRPRSIGSAVLVALASLTLLVMGLLLRRERPSTQVARLAHLDQLCAARSYFSRRDSLPDPTTAPPAIAPPLSVNNRAGFVRRVAASPPSSHPPSRGDGHYVWEYTIRY